jgi:hypothetical protein
MPTYGSQNFNLSLRAGDTLFLFGKPVTVALSASPSGAVRNSNVVTFTTGAAHHFVAGMQVVATGVGSVGNTQFNNLYVILTVPSSTTFTAQPLQQGPSGHATDSGNMNQVNDTGGGGNVTSIQAEVLTAPIASIAVSLANTDEGNNDNVAMEIFFDGAPGAFEIDAQEADTETVNAYQIASGGAAKLTVISANNTGRIDMTNVVARFMRAYITTLTNAVGIIVRLSR